MGEFTSRYPVRRLVSHSVATFGRGESETRHRSILDNILGELIWNSAVGWYEGQGQVAGRTVSLLLEPQDHDIPPELTAARKTFLYIRDHDDELRRHAAQCLLERCNRGNGETTEERFTQSIRLAAIELFPDGRAKAYYDDGKLFQGQPICIAVRVDGTLEWATLAGG
jgi:hypothetical protein